MPTIYRPKKKQTRPNTGKRKQRQAVYNTPRWKKLRAAKIMDNPLCEICEREGRTTPAQHVHHIISFMDGFTADECDRLAYDYDNLMSLCVECHRKEHGNDKRSW